MSSNSSNFLDLMERRLMLSAPPVKPEPAPRSQVTWVLPFQRTYLATGHRFAARGAIQDGKRYMGRLQDCWLLISPFGGFRVYGIQPKSSGLQTVSKFAFHCRRAFRYLCLSRFLCQVIPHQIRNSHSRGCAHCTVLLSINSLTENVGFSVR